MTKAFVGSQEDTGWHSVKTFYEYESHGKKIIDATISDWYNCSYSYVTYRGGDDETKLTQDLVGETVDWYFDNHKDDSRTNYDEDGDGYIDAVSIIYAAPDYNSHDYGKDPKTHEKYSNFWAYVYWIQDSKGSNKKDVNNPGANCFLWASYSFLNKDTSHCAIDTHAYIHESGHLFGLEDYYDYAANSYSPAGGFSMQDYNVGGHDPYSLATLGWTNNYIPTATTTYTISPFESSGDVIMLINDYEDSVFDEYLLIELYSPTGTNKMDSDYKYAETVKGPTNTGIRLWHVDSRLIYKLSGQAWTEANITNQIYSGYSNTLLCTNNTYDSSQASYINYSPLAGRGNYNKYKLLQLIRNNDYFGTESGKNINNNALFYQGDSFTMNKYKLCFTETGKLNSGRQLKWSFTVDSLSSTSATITVNKL